MAVAAATPSANRILKPVKATAESLAGYGYLIGEPGGVSRDKIDFYGQDVKVTQPARFHGNADLCLNLVSFRPRSLAVKWMEFHTKHTQTFVPLAGKPFYMVLGKPTCRRADGSWDAAAGALPDPASVQAFSFDGTGGIVMEVGTWHEVPFPIDGATHFVCICTNETNDNLEAQGADGECDGGDLTKRHIAKHLGYTFEISP
ncbi:MAG: ureidoglycolate lyase [Rhodospirillaceae bacterium]|nr:ureidoglycolate lyase [Rhodospirillaceae bacterium]